MLTMAVTTATEISHQTILNGLLTTTKFVGRHVVNIIQRASTSLDQDHIKRIMQVISELDIEVKVDVIKTYVGEINSRYCLGPTTMVILKHLYSALTAVEEQLKEIDKEIQMDQDLTPIGRWWYGPAIDIVTRETRLKQHFTRMDNRFNLLLQTRQAAT